MNELFSYLLDEEVLKKLRERWIKLYDFNFVDNEIIGGLLNTKKNIADLLTFIYNKATASNLPLESKETQIPKSVTGIASTTEGTKAKDLEESKEGKEIVKSKSVKKVTVPVPFNLSENKPRVLQEPMAIPNQPKFKPLPLGNYQKTSLKDIEEKRKEHLQIIKNNIRANRIY